MKNNLQITETDYDSILDNFKNYLKSQDEFKDYNFDGSSLSIFLDVLSYNTFYNAFYINAIGNEMFLDSATKRENVVSRAKALGYVPSSSVSSYAYIDIEAHINKASVETPSSNSFISLNSYAIFTTTVQEDDFNFITPETNALKYDSDGGDYWIYKKQNVKIVQGKIYTYSWKVQNEYDRYIIPNKNADINSLIVKIYTTEDSNSYTTFTKADNFLNVDENSDVYWIYEGDDENFYIEFGNGEFGSKLDISNIVYIEYIVTEGEDANGAKLFNIGNYSYSNSSIREYDVLSVTNSNYIVMNVINNSGAFTNDEKVRGETSNSIAYVYSFDNTNNILKLYGADASFQFGETIHEESVLGSNVVYGANAVINSIKTETSVSTGGSEIEDIESIKFYAPKFYSAQNRLITSVDYETIIKNDYPYIDNIVCWGGEEEDPQQLGEIFISCKPRSREFLDQWEKDYIIENVIEDKKMIGVNVQIVDADYIYIKPTINIKYNSDINPNTTKEKIETDTIENIKSYCRNFCHKFKSTFYYSVFVTNIDESNEFILGNETTIQMGKHFKPNLNVATSELLKYANAIKDYSSCESIITSSTFSCNVSGTTYDNCYFQANNTYLSIANSTSIVSNNVGTINYNNGIIQISNVIITETAEVDSSNDKIIKIYCVPENLDLESEKNQILKIDSNINIDSTAIRQSR